MSSETIQNLSGFVSSIAEVLRGDFKQSEYGKVILPFVVMRRLDCILEGSKDAIIEAAKTLPDGLDDATRDMILFAAAGSNIKVYNLSRFTFDSLKGQDAGQLHQNLIDYITKFSPNVRDIFLDKFRFSEQLKRLKDSGTLWNVFERFCEIDLHPDKVTNLEMGYLFEELIRRFSEMSNETAGEHFTPREVIKLIVDLLIANDDTKLTGRGVIRQVYDPACGTGGMLALTKEALKEFNAGIRVELFGQELNDESFGICKSDMLVTGHDPEQIAFDNSLTKDAHEDKKFHYMLSNPPYGVDWKKYREPIDTEAESMGSEGRFGAGLPRTTDGQLLFLQHMISKMRDDEEGSRIGIVMSGSPLFTGGAKSGESEIRRWMLQNDWVEAIVALPTNLFYNTDIQTFVWILSNRKASNRLGKIQLIDASTRRFWTPLRRNLGQKNREIHEGARADIVRIYASFRKSGNENSNVSKIFDVDDFGYRQIRIERPLRLNFQTSEERVALLRQEKAFLRMDEIDQQAVTTTLKNLSGRIYSNREAFLDELVSSFAMIDVRIDAPLRKALLNALSERDDSADICMDKSGNPEPDVSLRDHELVPLKDDWRAYFKREVQPIAPDAWVDAKYKDHKDKAVGRLGYEINFNRHFRPYVKPREIDEIDGEIFAILDSLSQSIEDMRI